MLKIPKFRELKSPVTAQIGLTEKCNNLCRYCYNTYRGVENQSNGLTLQDSMKIAKKISDNEVFEVVLTGGEPLLRRDLLYPLSDYFSKNNIDVRMNTNLVLINEEDVRQIKDCGVLSVFASLSSYDRETYNYITQTKNFDKAVKGIETLLQGNISLGLNMVVSKLNKNQVYETGKFLNNLGIRSFSATPASPCDYMPREIELNSKEVVKVLDDLLQLEKDFGMSVDVVEPIARCIVDNKEKYGHFLRRDCAAGKMTIYIGALGEVTPCTHIPEVYGNLLSEDLSDIWKRMAPWRDGSFVPLRCYPCNELQSCSFGCREAARINKGSYTARDPWAEDLEVISKKRLPKKAKQLNPEINLKIAQGLKFRKEEEGYLVFCSNTHSATYINPSFFNLLSNLNSRDSFTIKSLQNELKDNRISNIINYLNSKGIIKS